MNNVDVGISLYLHINSSFSNNLNPALTQLLIARKFTELNIPYIAQELTDPIRLNLNGTNTQYLCNTDGVSLDLSNLDSCESCVSKLSDIDVPETCPEIFQNRQSNISMKNFQMVIDDLNENLRKNNTEKDLSPPIANMTEYVGRVENYAIVRTNDSTITSNLKRRRSISRALDTIIPTINSQIEDSLKKSIGNILDSVNEISFEKKGPSSDFPGFTEL
ncbi:hypothetical protein BpHYR1_026655 [Brachionus plicatilis]|uniref:Uncharacterized protein n=1 Tax=Brachionus plicatilis TaxID=10195 RepID=A0A3M7RMH9_BRAPC|nr:hypothetical protein BpHYR1_026655 [Brachionus plicatilis]